MAFCGGCDILICIAGYNLLQIISKGYNMTYETLLNKVELIEQKYTEKLHNPDMIYTQSSVFLGLLLAVRDKFYYGVKDLSVDDLENAFRIFQYLVTKYNAVPLIGSFCLMVDKTRDYVMYMGNSNKPERQRMAKCISDFCESGIAGRTATHNSIGSMFILKAKYGYHEQPHQVEITTNATPQIDKTDLLALSDTVSGMPELPDMVNGSLDEQTEVVNVIS